MQISHTSFNKNFYNGVLGESSLHLPYSIIDCKQDFTIYGWWYPKIYADGVYRPCLTRNIPDGNSTGHRILIMGNDTTSTQLKAWIGSNGSETTITVNTAITVKTNEWNFFCLRRTGDNIYLTLGNSTGIRTDVLAIGAHLNTDETGQVWQVGEYANNESDAYHRDYIFYQGAKTTTEIEEIFKTKMKAKNNSLLIQKGITTGVTL